MSDSLPPSQPHCPVSFALEIFGDRWTLLVLRDLMLEARYQFKDLLAANPGLATNVLADRLRRLERRSLVSKSRHHSDARQFLYKPTPLAISVVPMLVEMIVWGARNGTEGVADSFVRRFESDRDGLIAELQEKIREQAQLS